MRIISLNMIMLLPAALMSACVSIDGSEVEGYADSIFTAENSEPLAQSGSMPDACATESPFTGNTLANGDVVCLPDAGINYLTIGDTSSYNSLAISTGHGGGDLSLYVRNGGWPATDGTDPNSVRLGNDECVVISNPSQYWTYITVTGSKSDASLVVDLGATSCRGTSDPPPPPVGDMPDACVTEPPFTGGTLTNEDVVCLPDAGINYFTIDDSDSYSSIAISTSHGSGDLSLYVKNGGWPATDGTDPNSIHVGNDECIVISNPSQYWTYITVTGSKSDASLVVDLGATSCRVTPDPTDPPPPPPDGGGGYPYDSVNILIYRFQFTDAPLTWTRSQIQEEMEKVKTYYTEQSYGRFTVTYDLSQPIIDINEPKTRYDNDFHGWRALWRQKVRDTGVDPDNPGERNIIMMTAPQVGNFNSSAAPPEMTIYHYGAGTVAHEIGHAVGLRHAKAVEAGPGRIIGVGDPETESLNYGNVYSMMGMGAHSLEEYNLMYKSFFGWVQESEAPMISASGTYRIYAFDHGTASGTNAPGNVGLRLESGNGLYIYWLEYRTTNTGYPDTKNGILINLQGYMENETDSRFWKHTSHLLDMTPGSKTPGWWGDDQTDSELLIGTTYTDHWGGFRIKPVAKGGTEDTANAWIDVEVTML